MTRQTKMTAPLDDRIVAAFADGATPDTVAALIQETESAARAAGERLQATVLRLRERLTEVQAAEEDDRRRAAYEEARAERDELAAELARVYPPLATQLACWAPPRLRRSHRAHERARAATRVRAVAGSRAGGARVGWLRSEFSRCPAHRPSGSVAGVRV